MNIKRFISIFLIFVLSLGMCSVAVAEGNSEIPEGYTPVYTAEDLNNIRNNLSGKYILMNDIDLSVYENWEPIGTEETPFMGELDGNGYLINNLTITQSKEENIYAGIFAWCQNSTVKNVSMIDCDIQTYSDKNNTTGLIAAKIKNSNITNCVVSGTISAYSADRIVVGGIVGTASENTTIYRCKNLSNISTCMEYFKAISIYNYCVGGIVGLSYATISECTNYGDIEINASGKENTYLAAIQAGGIVGTVFGEISNSYNIGDIHTTGQSKKIMLGGVAGYRMPNKDLISVYSIGNIYCNENNVYIGSIVGYLDEFFSFDGTVSEAILANCYYVESENAFGLDNSEHKENVLGLPADEFHDKNNFSGFDFENVWQMDEEFGRPILFNEPQIKENEPEPDPDPDPDPNEKHLVLIVLKNFWRMIVSVASLIVNAIKSIL